MKKQIFARHLVRVVALLTAALGFATAPSFARPPLIGYLGPAQSYLGNAPPPLPIVSWDALQKQLGGPTLLSLKFNDTPALEAIEALRQQAPMGVRALNGDWKQRDPKTVTGDYRARPFWEVTRDLVQQLDASLLGSGYWGSGLGLAFHPYHDRGEGSGLVSSAGPAIFVLTKAEFNRAVPQGEDRPMPGQELVLSGQLYLDPKLRLRDSVILHIDEAIDENGAPLAPTYDPRLDAKKLPLDLRFYLRPTAQNSGRLETLRGTMHAAVAYQVQSWSVPNILDATGAHHTFDNGSAEGGVRVEVREVKKDGDNYRVVLQIVGDSPFTPQTKVLSTGQRIVIRNGIAEPVQLLDAENRYFIPMGGSTTYHSAQGKQISTLTAIFNTSLDKDDHQSPPARLVVNYETDWRELIVPFNFENIPLP